MWSVIARNISISIVIIFNFLLVIQLSPEPLFPSMAFIDQVGASYLPPLFVQIVFLLFSLYFEYLSHEGIWRLKAGLVFAHCFFPNS